MPTDQRTRVSRGLRFDLVRVTIEFITPFAVSSGESDVLARVPCTLDADGLPAIPGSTLAGVLRHALAEGGDPATHPACQQEFGFQDDETDGGQTSRVELSWAQVHDAEDRPAPFHGSQAADPVLQLLRSGIRRDHVRLDEGGVPDERGKFDRVLVPAGARFTFEIVRHGPAGGLDRILDLLVQPQLRIGRAGRAGLGRFKVVRVHGRPFDLSSRDDLLAYAQLPRALDRDSALPAWPTPTSRQETRWLTGEIRLQPEDYWMFGGGAAPSGGDTKGGRPTDISPWSEPRISWSTGPDGCARASVHSEAEAPFLALASGLKGALRHRVAFYDRATRGHWATRIDDEEAPPSQDEARDASELLFGFARDGAGEDATGLPGLVYLDDIEVASPAQGRLEHVSIDRFTGGALDGALYSEEPLYAPKGAPMLCIPIGIDLGRLPVQKDSASTVRALRALGRALDDLCRRRLALGRGASRGHGRFTGTWSLGSATTPSALVEVCGG